MNFFLMRKIQADNTVPPTITVKEESAPTSLLKPKPSEKVNLFVESSMNSVISECK